PLWPVIRASDAGLTGSGSHADLATCALNGTPSNRKTTTTLSGGSMPFVPAAELKNYIGKDLGRSEWLTIEQDRIDQFAECTGDHQFIHVDPEKAKLTPFGTTIAHGFLSLSLIPALCSKLQILPEGMKMGINYGLDSVRFIQPV